MLKMSDDNTKLDIGFRVICVNGDGEPMPGIVKWIGKLGQDTSWTIGIEFDDFIGGGDGSFRNERLFICKSGHGEFVDLENVIREVDYKNTIETAKQEKEKEDLVKALTEAIKAGEKEKALKIKKRLQESKRKLQDLKNNNMIQVELYVENVDESFGPVPYSLSLRKTLKELKEDINKRYKFPADCQTWIVGDRVVTEITRPLSQIGKLKDGSPLYLYVKSNDEKCKPKWWVCKRCNQFNIDALCKSCFLPEAMADDDWKKQNQRLESKNYLNSKPHLWMCYACTKINYQGNECEDCSAIKSPEQPYLTKEDQKSTIDAINKGSKEFKVGKTAPIQEAEATTGWLCSGCITFNEGHLDKCGRCKDPRPKELIGNIDDVNGNEMEVDKKESKVNESVETDGWVCLNCTVYNVGLAGHCLSCKAQKTTPLVADRDEEGAIGGSFQGWVCKSCTYVNCSDDDRCKECRLPPQCSSTTKESRQWECETCCSMNVAGRPGCIVCTSERPKGFQVTEEEEKEWQMTVTGSRSSPMDSSEGWTCTVCTLVNPPARPGCSLCAEPRPAEYKVPDSELERWKQEEKARQDAFTKQREEIMKKQFEKMKKLDDNPLNAPAKAFECKICFTEAGIEEGVQLKSCLHEFCRECLAGHITNSEVVEVKCPYIDDDYKCDEPMQEREIRALVSKEEFEKLQHIGLNEAKGSMKDAYHCKTPNCEGWCVYDAGDTSFRCPICEKENCINCQTFHEGMNCKEFQDKLETDSRTNEELKKTKEGMERMLKDGEAMKCPSCQTIVIKFGGCDYLQCRVCRIGLCWATKGARWGPNGLGDTSGGCGCKSNGRLCHPKCQNCH